jgi:hypothetical protein
MAAPHAGGTAALYLSSHPGDTPAMVESALVSASKIKATSSKDGAPIALIDAGTF